MTSGGLGNNDTLQTLMEQKIAYSWCDDISPLSHITCKKYFLNRKKSQLTL